MKCFKLKTWSVFCLFTIVASVVYWNVWNGFFQQDEWAGLGHFYTLQNLDILTQIKALYLPMFQRGLRHFLPWTPLMNYARYALFGLNYAPYALFGLFSHAVAAFLVFLLALRLTKEKRTAFISALFFSIASSASQAVTWVGTSVPTQLAAIFSLLTIIFWLDWLNENKSKKLRLSVLCLILAIGFKETTLFLFILLPAFGLLIKPRYGKKFLIVFGSVGVSYAVLRFLTAGVYQGLVLLKLVYSNLVKVLFTGVAQTIYPQEVVLFLADKALQWLEPAGLPSRDSPAYNLFVESKVVMPFLCVLGILTILVLIIHSRRQKNTRQKTSYLSILLFLTPLIPLAFIPTGELEATFLAPRGLYLPLVGAAVLAGVVVEAVLKKKSKLLILIVVFFLAHIFVLRQQVNQLIFAGQERRSILEKIKSRYADLPDEVIFYTESDSSFYGISGEERVMPFQSGFGQTLLVWYQDSEQFPTEFFRDRFLWEITDGGYKKVGNRGFGYFRDFELLTQTLEKETISNDSVVAFRYDSDLKEAEDTSEEIRGRLTGFFAKKKEVLPSSISISTSHNTEEAYLVLDGKRETFWSSNFPYVYSQYFEIDLQNKRKIAQIVIDAYNNKDQNKVGYSVLLSDDGQEWEEVFYAKCYPPKEDGLVNIYIKPQPARFLRIKQEGYHKFAPWVIHELEIYETID